MSTISDHGPLPTTSAAASPTGEATAHHSVSSAEYIVSEIKKRKKGASLIAAIFVLAIGAGVFFYFNRAHALTDKDTILIADFANSTGESVFDGTLKQALAVQLGQTPFLNVLPDERVRQTLRFMGRSPDERITRDVGREICQRQSIKALLTGSISSLGSHYVITLEALNAQTGDSIARDQVEASSKEEVLSALNTSASRLREKLGESLTSIKKYAVPIDQATTSSLDALKAYATGNELRSSGKTKESYAFYKRAIELDPNFAMAYARLAVYHANNFELEQASQYALKSYELRDRVSEPERFYISEKYHTYVTGDLDKAIQVLQAWAKTYPNDFIPHNNLANNYGYFGMVEESLKESIEAVRLDPRSSTARGNMIDSFIRLGRYDEAKQAHDEMRVQFPDALATHFYTIKLAFVANDMAAVEREMEWAKGKAIQPEMLGTKAAIMAIQGKIAAMREAALTALQDYKNQDRKELAGQTLTEIGGAQASVGLCKEAMANTAAGLELSRSRLPILFAAANYAVCGDSNRSEALIEELTKRYPSDTIGGQIMLPEIRAIIACNRNKPDEAIQLLEPGRRFDLGTVAGFRANYIRGLAHLKRGAGKDAVSEFQNIINNRSRDLFSQLYPLAHLGLARAYVLTGDQGMARKTYQDFFALWRDADPDLPVMIQAKKEYEALK
jgi:pentatricopeptide repeat protein